MGYEVTPIGAAAWGETPPQYGRLFQGRLQRFEGVELSVVVDNPTSAVVGEGVRVKLRIPVLFEQELRGRIASVQSGKFSSNRGEIGIEVLELPLSVRRIVTRYLGMLSTSGRDDATMVTIIPKYFVWTKLCQLRIWIDGILDAIECQRLCALVSHAVDQSHRAHLFAYIDAADMKPCSTESQMFMKRCFALLGLQLDFLGVMHVKCGAARLQLRRLAREAGIGDRLACFECRTDAELFWRQVSEGGANSGTFSRRGGQ